MGGDDAIPLGQFLWERIAQLGVGAIFGLPGDMNLSLLDYIHEVEQLHWIGNSNELNAAYAADGYSRVKGCPGVVLTTMGVGELSAINGIAGAFSESVKLISIVGTAPLAARNGGRTIHHNLGQNPDHFVYDKISSHVRVAHCWLDNVKTATKEIDRVIKECYLHSRPVYIYVPLDMVHRPIPKSGLSQPLNLLPSINKSNQERAIELLLHAIYSSKNPVLLVDSLVARHGAKPTVQDLASLIKFPTFSPPMGKSIIDETKPYFYGVYSGKISYPGIQAAVEKDSDLVIHLGPFLSDSNTGGFSSRIEKEKLIYVHANNVTIKGQVFDGIPIKSFLSTLLEAIDKSKLPQVEKLNLPPQPTPKDAHSTLITQSWIWKRIGTFLRPGDLLFADTGTAQFAFLDAVFPDITYTMQGYFASLGYSLPATFGGAMASRELKSEGKVEGRVILVIGDGALQLTVQEISTMIKEGLDVIIMVINNKGYTIERAILNPKEKYHDIQPWDYKHLLAFFGDKESASKTRTVRTKDEFDAVVDLPEFNNPTSIQVLEVIMDKMDIPWRIRATVEGRPSVGRPKPSAS